MKLCKDCRYYRGGNMFARCAYYTDPVDGSAGKFCDFERDKYGKCGPQGKLWRPKDGVPMDDVDVDDDDTDAALVKRRSFWTSPECVVAVLIMMWLLFLLLMNQ